MVVVVLLPFGHNVVSAVSSSKFVSRLQLGEQSNDLRVCDTFLTKCPYFEHDAEYSFKAPQLLDAIAALGSEKVDVQP